MNNAEHILNSAMRAVKPEENTLKTKLIDGDRLRSQREIYEPLFLQKESEFMNNPTSFSQAVADILITETAVNSFMDQMDAPQLQPDQITDLKELYDHTVKQRTGEYWESYVNNSWRFENNGFWTTIQEAIFKGSKNEKKYADMSLNLPNSDELRQQYYPSKTKAEVEEIYTASRFFTAFFQDIFFPKIK